MLTRQCLTCDTDISDRHGNTKLCVACAKEREKEYDRKYYQENKEKISEYRRKYYQENKEKISAYDRKYHQENKEKKNERNRKYHQENSEKVKKRQRKYYQDNKEKIQERMSKYRQDNKEKTKEYQRKYRKENKEKTKEYKGKYYQGNKDEISERQRKYRQENKEKRSECRRKYYQENKEKVQEYHRKYQRTRIKNDPVFRLHCRISSAIRLGLKGGPKSKRSLEYTGAESWESLWEHIKATNPPNLVEAYEKGGRRAHLDHIIPLAAFRRYNDGITSEEKKTRMAWHYSNLRLLTAKENRAKGDKIPYGIDINHRIQSGIIDLNEYLEKAFALNGNQDQDG